MKRILAVEDDPDIAGLYRMILRAAGYRVQWAGDLFTARTILAGPFPPDLVILERVLPDGDGLEFCRELKASRPSLPVIVLTAWVAPGAREESLAAGADRFMTKPFAVNRLEAKVRRLLGDSPRSASAQASGTGTS